MLSWPFRLESAGTCSNAPVKLKSAALKSIPKLMHARCATLLRFYFLIREHGERSCRCFSFFFPPSRLRHCPTLAGRGAGKQSPPQQAPGAVPPPPRTGVTNESTCPQSSSVGLHSGHASLSLMGLCECQGTGAVNPPGRHQSGGPGTLIGAARVHK